MQSVEFIMDIFRRLEEQKIRYGILRKSEEIERGKAHDLDVVVDFHYKNHVLNILNWVAEEKGWNKILNVDKDCGNLKSVHYSYLDKGYPQIVHFDLFNNFSWNGLTIIGNQELLDGVYKKGNLFCVSRANEVTIKLMSRLIYHGYVKDEYKNDICEYAKSNTEELTTQLKTFLGEALANRIVSNCKNENWNLIAECTSEIRQMCMKNCESVAKLKKLRFKFQRFFSPQGMMIVFLGTDGSGKSTIIEGLPNCIGDTFDKTQIEYYHWRPGFLKSPKGEKSGSKENSNEPHKKRPYNIPISLIKFFYYNLDYILGYFFCIKPALAKNKLVIFDRYYYDYMLDKYRYRFDIPDLLIRTMMCIIPKPHITFLFIGDPVVLYERKHELSVEEIAEQTKRLMLIKDIVPNKKVINVNKSIDDVIGNVSCEILMYMSRR